LASPVWQGSSIRGLDDHPVVATIVYRDAEATLRGRQRVADGSRVGISARGGLEQAEFAWGDALTPGGRHMANIWQGEFPHQNLVSDGYAPDPRGRCVPQTDSVFRHDRQCLGVDDRLVFNWAYRRRAEDVLHSPKSARRIEAGSYDPCQPQIGIPRKVVKGGSHLCAPNLLAVAIVRRASCTAGSTRQ